MNDFLDVLETQLTDAAGRRHGRRRPLPRRRVGFEALLTASAVAASLALVVVFGGGSAEQFSATTPGAASAPLPAAAQNARVVVLNLSGEPGRGRPVAERLRAAGVTVVAEPVADESIPLGGTEVQYRPGAAPAALAISRFLGGVAPDDAGLRVFPVGETTAGMAGGSEYDVVVLVGLDTEKTRFTPVDTPVAFTSEGCPSGVRPRALDPQDAADAAAAALRAWPRADGAVPRAYALASDASFPGRDHGAAIAAECGEDMVARTALVALHLTANEGDPDAEEVVLYVSRVRAGWDAWTATR